MMMISVNSVAAEIGGISALHSRENMDLGQSGSRHWSLSAGRLTYSFQCFPVMKMYGNPRGAGLNFGLDGNVPLQPQNPYSFLRVTLAKKR